MKVVEFYKRLIESFGLTYDEKENCFLTGNSRKVNVDKKVLSLPTPEAMASFNDRKDEIVIYNPVHENVLRRDSKMFSFTQKAISTSLFTDYITLVMHLIELAADVDKHAGLNAAQRNIIACLPPIDEKFKKTMEKIFDKTDPTKSPRAIDLVVQRGDSVTKASRIAKVRWGILESLHKNKDNSVLGVSIRKRDVDILEKIHSLIFDNRPARLTPINDYTQQVITNESVAPSYRVLLEAYHDVKFMFIELYKPFEGIFPPLSSTDLEWESYLDNFKVYRTKVPSFPGNEGEEPVKTSNIDMPADYSSPRSATASTPVATPVTRQPATRAPAAPTPQVDVSSVDAPLTMDMFNTLTEYKNAVAARNRQTNALPVYNTAPQQSYYNQVGMEVTAGRFGGSPYGQPAQPNISYAHVGGGNYGQPPAVQQVQYAQPQSLRRPGGQQFGYQQPQAGFVQRGPTNWR